MFDVPVMNQSPQTTNICVSEHSPYISYHLKVQGRISGSQRKKTNIQQI